MSRASFTLIELLVVIAIVAILSVVVIISLNPTELLRQARDSNRLSDLNNINTALNLYQTDVSSGSLGTASTTYLSIPDPAATSTLGSQCQGLGLTTSSLPSGWSYHCAASSTYRKADGFGWLPVDFTQISFKTPLATLPIDPVNTTSSGNYYTYTPGGSWELTASLEAAKNKLGGASDKTSTDGGSATGLYEIGTNLTLLPVDYGDPTLVGYWTFEEGLGSTTSTDRSGKGNNGTWNGGGTHYAAGKVGSWAGMFDGTSTYVFIPIQTYTAISMCSWISGNDPSRLQNIVSANPGILAYASVSAKFAVYDGAGWWYASTTISAGIWYQTCLTFDGSTKDLRLYTNGNLEYSGLGLGSYTNGSIDSIGKGHDAGRNFNGLIDDVRVYNRALTTTEVAAIYNATR
jgi:prepilin-type N-terminal cleavage/methylation domain-containing protein